MAGLLNDIKNKALNAALGIADSFTPILKESKFRETGFLTPDEFVAAGDFLTDHCPTWQWAPASNSKAAKDYLPKDKQFLLTKNVPCTKRCRHLMENLKHNQEKIVEEGTGDGGWVDTHYSIDAAHKSDDATNQSNQVVEIKDDNKAQQRLVEASADMDAQAEDDDDGDAIDMDAYDHNVIDDDDTTVIKPAASTTKPAASKDSSATTSKNLNEDNDFGVSALSSGNEEDEDIFIPTRTYDLHITYDNYYRTPRLWLSGYDENHKPLTINQMYDDISEDHAKKTVTFENHPHIPGTQMASIHPCRHADVMKKLINMVADSGKELEVYNYLMIFLKFVQSVIPTIEYDYTRNFSM